jgi:hypothetical protein
LNICFDSHFPEELFEKYALRSASSLEAASFEGHLLLCADCQTHLAKTEEYLAVIRAALMELAVDTPARISAQPALAL